MRNSCKFSHKFKAKLPAIARNKPCELRVTLTAGCRLIYLKFAGEFTRGVIAVLLAIACIFACNCRYLCLQLPLILPLIAGNFACESRKNCQPIVGELARVLHVKLSVNYLLFSGKFTCGCRQFAYVLREVLVE